MMIPPSLKRNGCVAALLFAGCQSAPVVQQTPPAPVVADVRPTAFEVRPPDRIPITPSERLVHTPPRWSSASTPFSNVSSNVPVDPVDIPASEDLARIAPVIDAAARPAAAAIPPAAPTEEAALRIAREVKDHPRDMLAVMDAWIYSVVVNGTAPEIGSVAMLPDAEREAVAAITDGYLAFRLRWLTEPNAPEGRKLAPLIAMADRLRALGALNLPTIVLCRRVEGFGNYTPMDGLHLPVGRANETLVYCEIDNLVAKQDPGNGQWSTQLSIKATLYTEAGTEVWADHPPRITDQSRSRRRDFYVVDRIKLPPTLPTGRYTLKLSVEDVNADRVAEATTPVAIVMPADTVRDANPFGNARGQTISSLREELK